MGKSIWIAVCLVTFCFSTVQLAGAEELKIGAGAAPVENILKPIREAFEKASGISINLIAAGPKIAMTDLVRGNVEAAAAGLSLQDWLALMKKEGQEVQAPETLRAVNIGKDRIVVVTHKDNPVSALTKEQLQGIFSGKIENWKEVGGADLPILVIWGTLVQGTNSMFVAKVMEGHPVTKDVIEVATAADIKQNVLSNPGAIGIGPAALVDSSVHAPVVPEVSREIILVTKGEPSPKVRKLLEFIKGEGGKYIRK
jgi:phosphate transport system substrate-binding protein